MTYSTPGPLARIDRHHRHDRGDSTPLDMGGSGAAARALPQGGGGASEAEILGFGMKVFLASLTMVFMGCFVAYLVIWFKNKDDWQNPMVGRELVGLAAATVLLVLADLLSARALKRAPDRKKARALTRNAAIIAGLYLVVQSFSWAPIFARVDRRTGGDLRMEDVLFLMLTIAHAVHVLGGIIANVIVLLRAQADGGPRRTTLSMLYNYWRFLTVVWVAVLALLIGL